MKEHMIHTGSPLTHIDEYPAARAVTRHSMAWGAVLAGASICLAFEVLLNFLGIGLGMASFSLNNNATANLGALAIIWLTISSILSMGFGGWFTGVFSQAPCKFKRAYYGLLAWSIASLASIIISISGAGALLGSAVSLAQNNLSSVVYSLSQSDNVTEELDNANKELGKASIFMCISFFLSAVAGASGAVWGGIKNDMDKQINK